MATQLYNSGKKALLTTVNWETADIRMLLVTSAYTFDATHDFVSSVAASEVSGTGYARVSLASRLVNVDDPTSRAYCDAADVTYTNASMGTPAAGIVYVEGASDAARQLLCYVDFPDTASNGANYTIQFNASGLFYI